MEDRNLYNFHHESDEPRTAQVGNIRIVDTSKPVFFSFHFEPDHWRTFQVRTMEIIEVERPVSGNAWEEVRHEDDEKIQKWIDEQLEDVVCTIVLIGTNTAGRKWINYEIKRSCIGGKGLLGIYIHNLLDYDKEQSDKGENPFEHFDAEHDGMNLSDTVKVYDPPYSKSEDVYNYIKENLENWVEKAISNRNNYSPEN